MNTNSCTPSRLSREAQDKNGDQKENINSEAKKLPPEPVKNPIDKELQQAIQKYIKNRMYFQ